MKQIHIYYVIFVQKIYIYNNNNKLPCKHIFKDLFGVLIKISCIQFNVIIINEDSSFMLLIFNTIDSKYLILCFMGK